MLSPGSSHTFPQSWPASCTSVWTTSTGSVLRTPTLCWTRAPPCSACGRAEKASGPRVSLLVPYCLLGHAHLTHLAAPSPPADPFHTAVDASLAVESLHAALRNIDRADIVASLEAPPTSLDEGACRLSDRDSALLSPGVLNGKTMQHNATSAWFL